MTVNARKIRHKRCFASQIIPKFFRTFAAQIERLICFCNELKISIE